MYVLGGGDVDDAIDRIEGGVGLLRCVSIDQDLDAWVRALSDLHHVAGDRAAGGLDRARGRHVAFGVL